MENEKNRNWFGQIFQAKKGKKIERKTKQKQQFLMYLHWCQFENGLISGNKTASSKKKKKKTQTMKLKQRWNYR